MLAMAEGPALLKMHQPRAPARHLPEGVYSISTSNAAGRSKVKMRCYNRLHIREAGAAGERT